MTPSCPTRCSSDHRRVLAHSTDGEWAGDLDRRAVPGVFRSDRVDRSASPFRAGGLSVAHHASRRSRRRRVRPELQNDRRSPAVTMANLSPEFRRILAVLLLLSVPVLGYGLVVEPLLDRKSTRLNSSH